MNFYIIMYVNNNIIAFFTYVLVSKKIKIFTRFLIEDIWCRYKRKRNKKNFEDSYSSAKTRYIKIIKFSLLHFLIVSFFFFLEKPFITQANDVKYDFNLWLICFFFKLKWPIYYLIFNFYLGRGLYVWYSNFILQNWQFDPIICRVDK